MTPTRWLALSHVAVILFGIGLAANVANETDGPKRAVFPPVEGHYYLYVNRIIDGDTVEVYHLVPAKVRLWGINAPEKNTQAGKESAVYLKSVLKEGQIVRARLFGTEKFGRTLGDFQGRDGWWISKMMVDSKNAVKWSGRGDKQE